MRQWAGVFGHQDVSPQPPVTRLPDQGCLDLHSRFKVASAEVVTGGGGVRLRGWLFPSSLNHIPVHRWGLATGDLVAKLASEGCSDLCLRFIPGGSSRQDACVLLQLHAIQHGQCLRKSWGRCGWREARASNCKLMGAMSPQKPGMLWSTRSSSSASGLRRKSVSSSNFMPSSRGNVSAKSGDVVVGVLACWREACASKWTTKVWSVGLLAWGLKVWCSCLAISKSDKTTTAGFRGAKSKKKSCPEVGRDQAQKTMKLGVEEWPD
eukprot:jgi/Bigna1/73912/fgenesh1_pg.26_\